MRVLALRYILYYIYIPRIRFYGGLFLFTSERSIDPCISQNIYLSVNPTLSVQKEPYKTCKPANIIIRRLVYEFTFLQ